MIGGTRYTMTLALVWFVAVSAGGRGEWQQHS